MGHLFKVELNSQSIQLLGFVLSIVIIKYGILGFLLAKYVRKNEWKERIDSIVTIILLYFLTLVSLDYEINVVNNKWLINIILLLLAIVIYYGINVSIGEIFHFTKSDNQVDIERLIEQVPFGLTLLTTGCLAPIFEEVIFRLYFQDLILGNTWSAILLSSLFFAGMHLIRGFSIPSFLTYTGDSIVIGSLYWLTGGILFSIILHVFINSLAVLFIYFPKLVGRSME